MVEGVLWSREERELGREERRNWLKTVGKKRRL